jgi:hypothetical protein
VDQSPGVEPRGYCNLFLPDGESSGVERRLTVLMGVFLAGCSASALPTGGSPSLSGSMRATPDSSRSASASPIDTPAPTIDPAATLAPSLPPGTLGLHALGWQTVVPELNRATAEVIGHWLAVGTLDRAEPTWFKKLVETRWRFQLFAMQQPVVDGPDGGRVLFVADNGANSEIRVVGVDGSAPRLVGTLAQVVYTARMSLDGMSAYLVVLDRATGRDQGVWRVSLQGNSTMHEVMPPPAVDLARMSGGMRLAATTRFVRTLRVSADGSEVARMACGEPYGECLLDVLTVADGRVTSYTPPEQSGELAAIGDGVMLGIDYCLPDTRCVTEGIHLAEGGPQIFPGRPPAIDAGGHLVLLQFPPPTVSARGFFVTHLDGSGTHLVLATDGSVRLIHQEGVDFEGVRLELPWGWVAVSLDRFTSDGLYVVTPAAVRLTDGGWVGLTMPQINPIGGGTD